MKCARGPRPLSIRLFAALFLVQATIAFLHQITRISATQSVLAAALPFIAFDRDLTIVAINARLTIAIIPVALVWFRASRVARWLVLAFTLAKIAGVPAELASIRAGGSVSWLWVATLALSCTGATLLFTRASARWFGRKSLITHAAPH